MAPDRSLPPLFEEFPPVSTEAWEAKIREDLGDADLDSVLDWESLEGVSLPAFRHRDEMPSLPHLPETGDTPPLARRTTPANAWRLRQDLTHPDPETAHDHALTALEGGCTDLGLGADPFGAEHRGLSVRSPDDLRTVLRDLPLDDVRLHLGRGPAAVVTYAALREALPGDPFALSAGGTMAYDPVAALATGAMTDQTTALDWAGALLERTPSPVRPLCVDLRPYHDAGASAVQELACGLAALSEQLAHLLDEPRALPLPALLDRLHVEVATSTSYFVEIAKLRALRLLVPQVVDAYADAADAPAALAPADLLVQAETSRRTETLYDPYVNMIRGTTEAMAAIVGGCDVLRVRPYDAAARPPDAFGTRIARNVQLILEHEAHFDVVADPAAGSYYVETATHALAERAWETFQSIEERGGMLAALADGAVQREIADVREERQAEVDDRSRVLVGTNHYPDLDETRLDEDFSCNNGITSGSTRVDGGLDALQRAIRAGAEGPDLLRGLREPPAPFDPLPRRRLAEPLEALRLQTERYAEREDRRPLVLLAPLGPPGPRSARATFARHFFGVAGFEIREPLHFDAPDDAVAEAAAVSADVLVVCSADGEYPDLVPAIRTRLNAEGLSPLLAVAGAPEDIDGPPAADLFVHRDTPLRERLADVQRRLGVRD